MLWIAVQQLYRCTIAIIRVDEALWQYDTLGTLWGFIAQVLYKLTVKEQHNDHITVAHLWLDSVKSQRKLQEFSDGPYGEDNRKGENTKSI